MESNELDAQPAEDAVKAETALPAQPTDEREPRELIERRHLEEVVERAVESKLHNYRLGGRRRFSKRAFKLAREAFKAAAWKVEGDVCPQIRFKGADLRRLAKHEFGDVPEGTISSDITLLNELAETPEAKTGFVSPLLNTSRGLRQVQLFLLSERTDHYFSFAVLNERGRVLVKRITKDVGVEEALEDLWVDQVQRNREFRQRLMRRLGGVAQAAVYVIFVLGLSYAVLPKEAKAAVRKFGREKIVEPLQRLLNFTPAMYWDGGSAFNSGAVCIDGKPVNHVVFMTSDEHHDPPYVVVRNGVIIKENLTDNRIEFEDRDIEPGRSYTYALGKRDPATGEVSVGKMVGTSVPLCPDASAPPNRPPVLSLTADQARGSAPMNVMFTVSVADDEERVRPFVFDFGDGTYMKASYAETVRHEYRYGGTYTATVHFSDTADNGAEAIAAIIVNGPPPPPPITVGAQNPWEQWRGIYFSSAHPVVGYVEDTFTIQMHPEYIVRHNLRMPVISYSWVFGDCLGAPGAATKTDAKSCVVGPFKQPTVTRRFAKPGVYDVQVYLVFENGDTANYHLGSVTVLPSKQWLADNPVDPATRRHYDYMLEAARHYPPKYPDLTSGR